MVRLYPQQAIGNNPQLKVANKKRSLNSDPISNKVQKLRCCVHSTGAIYRAPVYDMSGHSLAAELAILYGSRLEVTAAPLSNGCCKGLLHCTINPIGSCLKVRREKKLYQYCTMLIMYMCMHMFPLSMTAHACTCSQYTYVMWIDPIHAVLQWSKLQLKKCLT